MVHTGMGNLLSLQAKPVPGNMTETTCEWEETLKLRKTIYCNH